MEQQRHPTMHRPLLFLTPFAAAGAAPSSALAGSAVSAVASNIRRAWSSNQQRCASIGETQGAADEDASACSLHRTSSRTRPQQPRCSLSLPAPQLSQRRLPRRAQLLPLAALVEGHRPEPQVGHGPPHLQPAPRPASTQRRRRTTRPSRLSAAVGRRIAVDRRPPRPPCLKPRSQPQRRPPVPRRSAALRMPSCKRRCIRRTRPQRRQRQPQLGLARPHLPSRPRHGETRVMEATRGIRRGRFSPRRARRLRASIPCPAHAQCIKRRLTRAMQKQLHPATAAQPSTQEQAV